MLLVVLLYMFTLTTLAANEPKPLKRTTTADHSKFNELQREFQFGPEVTKACLTCHTEAAGQIQLTKHWKWEYLNPHSGQTLGKKHISTTSAFPSPPTTRPVPVATSATVGRTPISNQRQGKRRLPGLSRYHRHLQETAGSGNPVIKDMELPPGSGKIVKGIDITKVAQKVGKSSRDTYGTCHFFGGGGDAVKHGDLAACRT